MVVSIDKLTLLMVRNDVCDGMHSPYVAALTAIVITP